MINILFLDGHARATIEEIRNIKEYFKEKIRIYVLDIYPFTAVRFSKYKDDWDYTKNYNLEQILSFCSKRKINIIFLNDDKTIHKFGENNFFKKLKDNGIVTNVYDYKIYNRVSNKYLIAKKAKEMGILTPKTQMINPENFNSKKLEIIFPIVIKPIVSIVDNKRGSVEYAKDMAELKMKVDKLKNFKKLILQEYIDGEGFGYESFINKKGDVLLEFGHKRIREVFIKGGGSSYARGFNIPRNLKLKCIKLLKSFNYHGPVMIEFKRERNKFYIIEINARFWGTLPLASFSEVNFSTYVFCDLLNLNYPKKNKINYNKYFLWLIGDLNHLFEVATLKKDGLGRRKPIIKEFCSFILSIIKPNTIYLNLRLKDPFCLFGEFLYQVTKSKYEK